MFRSGQLHITGSIPQEKIDSYKTLYPEELKNIPLFWNLLLPHQY